MRKKIFNQSNEYNGTVLLIMWVYNPWKLLLHCNKCQSFFALNVIFFIYLRIPSEAKRDQHQRRRCRQTRQRCCRWRQCWRRRYLRVVGSCRWWRRWSRLFAVDVVVDGGANDIRHRSRHQRCRWCCWCCCQTSTIGHQEFLLSIKHQIFQWVLWTWVWIPALTKFLFLITQLRVWPLRIKKTKEESGFFLSQLCTLASSRKCLAQEIWAEE